MKTKTALLVILTICIMMLGCTTESSETDKQTEEADAPKDTIKQEIISVGLTLSSPEFEHRKKIPSKFTCQGEDINPELNIAGVPEGTKSFVLIMDDPDAPFGVWDHWIVWNINPSTEKISEDSVPRGALQGINNWGRNDYGGPCPPAKHNYEFKLYAIDTTLELNEGATKGEVMSSIQNHIIENTKLIGTYQKE